MSRGLLTPRVDAPIDMACPVNWLHPANRNLLGWWLCHPGSIGGRGLMDMTGRFHTTWVTSGVNDRPVWVGCQHSAVPPERRFHWYWSARFAGEAETANLSSFSVLDARLHISSQTFMLWARPTNLSAQRMIGGATNVITSGGYEWAMNTGGSLDFAYYNGAVRGWYSGTGTTVANTWNHHAGVVNYAAGNVRFYINGRFVNQVSISAGSAMVFNNDTFDIGHASANAGWLGHIDDVRLFSGTKTDAEIQAIFENSASGNLGAANRVRMPFAMMEQAAPGGNRRRRIICGASA